MYDSSNKPKQQNIGKKPAITVGNLTDILNCINTMDGLFSQKHHVQENLFIYIKYFDELFLPKINTCKESASKYHKLHDYATFSFLYFSQIYYLVDYLKSCLRQRRIAEKIEKGDDPLELVYKMEHYLIYINLSITPCIEKMQSQLNMNKENMETAMKEQSIIDNEDKYVKFFFDHVDYVEKLTKTYYDLILICNQLKSSAQTTE